MQAHVGEVSESKLASEDTNKGSDVSNPGAVVAMLSNVLAQLGEHSEAHDCVADALNALHKQV